MDLRTSFLAHAGAVHDGLAGRPDLDTTLANLVAQARLAWPALDVPDDAFVRHIAERLPAKGDPWAALAELHAGDLRLALGCVRGDPAALGVFETHFLSELTSYLARRDTTRAFTDDVKQALRMRLLVSTDGQSPRIASYSGRGPLLAWLRSAAARMASDLRRFEIEHGRKQEKALVMQPTVSADPELAYLKTRYSADLDEAFAMTLSRLPRRERTLLRLHYLEGMNTQSVATFFDLSQRTIKRWLVLIRTEVLAELRRRLAEKLDLQPSQIDTLMGIMQSRLDPAICRLLEGPDGGS